MLRLIVLAMGIALVGCDTAREESSVAELEVTQEKIKGCDIPLTEIVGSSANTLVDLSRSSSTPQDSSSSRTRPQTMWPVRRWYNAAAPRYRPVHYHARQQRPGMHGTTLRG